MFRSKFLTLSSVALGGWFAGLVTEKCRNNCESLLAGNSRDTALKPMPGNPIFGTVSAASIIPANSDAPAPVPREPPLNAPRVSQVTNTSIFIYSFDQTLHYASFRL
jgi:hypothetical protein